MVNINNKKLLIVLPLLALMLFVGAVSFRWMLADVYQLQAKRYIKRWESAGVAESLPRWQRAHVLITRAAALHQTNPVIQHNLGRIYEWYGFVPDKNAVDLKQHLRAAEAAYVHATQIRPTYPISWSGLAMVKARRWSIDEQFAMAIDKVRELGPYETNARLQAVTAGLYAWPALTPATKNSLMELLILGLDRDATVFFKRAEQAGRIRVLCAELQRLSDNGEQTFSHIIAPYAKSRFSGKSALIDIVGNPVVASQCRDFLPLAVQGDSL